MEASWQKRCGHDLELFVLPMASDLSLPAVLRLARLMSTWRPDIVLCCNQRALRLGVAAARLTRSHRVIMRDGLQGSLRASSYNRWLTRFVDGFVVNADAIRRELLAWLPSDRRAGDLQRDRTGPSR